MGTLEGPSKPAPVQSVDHAVNKTIKNRMGETKIQSKFQDFPPILPPTPRSPDHPPGTGPQGSTYVGSNIGSDFDTKGSKIFPGRKSQKKCPRYLETNQYIWVAILGFKKNAVKCETAITPLNYSPLSWKKNCIPPETNTKFKWGQNKT